MLDSTEGNPNSVEHLLKNGAREDKPSHHLFFTFVNVSELEHTSNEGLIDDNPTQVSVSISESIPQPNSKRTEVLRYKESMQKKMRHKSWTCEPGWWCNRCLQASAYGSFSKCSFVCGKCAPEFICNGREKEAQIDINVNVAGLNLPQKKSVPAVHRHHHHQRIPRIIHQTYFEDITKETFPQLVRLQNTWKASGGSIVSIPTTLLEIISEHTIQNALCLFLTLYCLVPTRLTSSGI
ncbi:glycosyltransferase family 32 protein [Skeletonema marinoi]|uniref:Glycosyltransferase family 32 protein n=1 Tax=Skeletonema marinoi TaxID=267567 RepID=A0AAD8Y189_9STRA|nr:glycosyltransferase family 32 protein [Skeletonema marinoi]